MLKNLKLAALYSLLFLVIFNFFFLQGFSDGNQTSDMFVLISVIISIIVIVLYVFFKRVLKSSNILGGIWQDAILLFLLAELAVICLTGELCFFGLLYKLKSYSGSDILTFKEKRDYSFSMSFLLADILFVILKFLVRKKTPSS
jgi:hypothetical protein